MQNVRKHFLIFLLFFTLHDIVSIEPILHHPILLKCVNDILCSADFAIHMIKQMEIERLQLFDDGPVEDGWSDKVKSSDRCINVFLEVLSW